MIRIKNLSVPYDETRTLTELAAERLGVSPCAVHGVIVVHKALDARRRNGAPIRWNYTLDVTVDGARGILTRLRRDAQVGRTEEHGLLCVPSYTPQEGRERPVVVGFGPAGIFAAWLLARAGAAPLVLERGQDVDRRTRDVAQFWRTGRLDTASNVQFGEGGAGTFSDGKLTARSRDPRMNEIIEAFVAAGAPEEIRYLQKPHIGTDVLRTVVKRLREKIIEMGGEVRFGAQVTDITMTAGRIAALTVNGSEQIPVSAVFLGIGHSARDTYAMLHGAGVHMEAKPFAVGVRIEHPQDFVDRMQYGAAAGSPLLPSADYALTFRDEEGGRGVYSFCMCPGGFVIPASTAPDECVVNGMSPANRGSRWANAGWVVELRPEDLASIHLPDIGGEPVPEVLAMMDFQERLERLCRINAGQGVKAPAQRMADFVARRNSSALPSSSFSPGLLASPLHFWMPDFVTGRLREGFRSADRVSRGFLTNEAVMIGVETRTSSPVRILRARETLRHVTLRGLYPCGEGAGYAGGIVSAAIDGERCAEQLAAAYGG